MKVYTLLLFVFATALLGNPQNLIAQCNGRYVDNMFSLADTLKNIPFTTSIAGSPDTLLMDVYVPHGDTATNRHFIIFAHGGAFFQGTKNDNDIQDMCTHFAKLGYVCASINYRLAPSVLVLYDSTVAFDYIIKATNDMKSAIRFIRKDASTVNTYNIDTNYIFGAGSSAGAIMIDFAETIDSLGEADASIQTAITNNGGIDGNSGNDGYSSKVKAVASLAGGISQLSWIGPNNPPMIFCQGTSDPIIPYDCAYVFTGYTGRLVKLFQLCGSDQMQQQCASIGIRNSIMPFAGQGHVPWSSHPDIMLTTDSTVAQFFYQLDCAATGVAPVINDASIIVYPNPASIQINIQLPANLNTTAEISILDITGRVVYTNHTISGQLVTVNTSTFAQGLYLIRLDIEGKLLSRKIYVSE